MLMLVSSLKFVRPVTEGYSLHVKEKWAAGWSAGKARTSSVRVPRADPGMFSVGAMWG